jgi:hypothetical protein
MTGVEKLIKKTGSAKALAEMLTAAGKECSRQVVEHWLNNGYVPGKWAPLVNRVTDIPLHDLNPTIYPKSVN